MEVRKGRGVNSVELGGRRKGKKMRMTLGISPPDAHIPQFASKSYQNSNFISNDKAKG